MVITLSAFLDAHSLPPVDDVVQFILKSSIEQIQFDPSLTSRPINSIAAVIGVVAHLSGRDHRWSCQSLKSAKHGDGVCVLRVCDTVCVCVLMVLLMGRSGLMALLSYPPFNRKEIDSIESEKNHLTDEDRPTNTTHYRNQTEKGEKKTTMKQGRLTVYN